jgi:hypothetical protein
MIYTYFCGTLPSNPPNLIKLLWIRSIKCHHEHFQKHLKKVIAVYIPKCPNIVIKALERYFFFFSNNEAQAVLSRIVLSHQTGSGLKRVTGGWQVLIGVRVSRAKLGGITHDWYSTKRPYFLFHWFTPISSSLFNSGPTEEPDIKN